MDSKISTTTKKLLSVNMIVNNILAVDENLMFWLCSYDLQSYKEVFACS